MVCIKRLTGKVAVLVLVVIGAGCLGAPSPIPWQKPGVLETPDFIVRVEPGLRPEEYVGRIEEISRIKQSLVRDYFPKYQGNKIGIALFRNRKSYNEYVRALFSLELLSHYSRNTIYIPLEAPDYIWRHELSHALLLNNRPGTMTFWLQEGLAQFVQANSFSKPVVCDGQSVAGMPPELAPSLMQLRDLPEMSVFSRPNYKVPQQRALLHPALAGFFIFYLWDQRLLFDFLNRLQADPLGAPESILTRNNPALLKTMHEEFNKWMQTNRPLLRIPGC